MKKIILFFLGCLALLQGCTFSEEKNTTDASNRIPVELVTVNDGDTIKVKYEVKTELIRYLLVDAPEMYHKTLGEQPIGREAQARNKELVENAKLEIEFDVGDRKDQYGRLLAYVYADGKSVQETLLKECLVRVAYVFPPNTKYLKVFETVQEEAKSQKLGIWQYPGYVTERGFDPSVVKGWNKGEQKDAEAKECLIKGNVNQKGNKIYHLPGSDQYDQTNPEKWFCSEKEAQDAGFRKAN